MLHLSVPRYTVWLLALFGLFNATTAAFGQTTWTNNSADFQWNTPGNWSAGVPTAVSDTFFAGAAPGNVVVPANAQVRTLRFNTGGYNLSGGTLELGFATNALLNTAGNNLIGSQVTFAGTNLTASVSGGQLTLSNQTTATPNNFGTGGSITVSNTGILQANVAPGAANPLGTLGVTLGGGTLRLQGGASFNGLTGSYFNSGLPNGNGVFNQLDTAQGFVNGLGTPALVAQSNIDFDNNNGGNNPPFAAVGFNSADNIVARWAGVIQINNPGTYTFGTRSDDGSVVFINGQNTPIVNNNFFQGMTTRTGTFNFAAPGSYPIEVYFYEGGGGAGMVLGYSGPDNGSPGGLTDFSGPISGPFVIPSSVLGGFATGATVLGNNVLVTANSTIDAVDLILGELGNLTINPTLTLTTTGPGQLRFASAQLGTSAGATTYNFNVTGSPVLVGTLTNPNAVAQTVTKLGSGRLILEGGNAVGTLNYSVEAGRLVAVSDNTNNFNPLGTGNAVQLQVAGATLELRSRAGDVTFNNRLIVNANATLLSGADTGTPTINLGGGANGVTIAAAATLTADTPFNVNLLGSLVGTGGLTKIGGRDLTLLGDNSGYAGVLTINNGAVVANSNTALGNNAPAGIVNGGGTLAFQGGVSLTGTNATTFTINGGGAGGRAGAIDNFNSTNTFAGAVTLGSNATVGAQNGTLNLTGTVANNGNLLTANVNGGAALSLSNVISGTGGLTKVGGGTLSLSGTNTYAGPTNIEAGVVNAQGPSTAAFGSSPVTVRLGGAGIITGPNSLGASPVSVTGTGSTFTFNPGTGNTTTATSPTVAAVNGGLLRAQSGTTNLSTSVVNLGAASAVPGLVEGYVLNSGFNLNIPNPGQNITGGNTPGIRLAQISNVTQNPATGWSDNNLWVYTGQIRANATSLTFAKHVDDSTNIVFNGNQILNNSQFNLAQSVTVTGLTPGQYYPIEIRLHNGGGGAGPNNDNNGGVNGQANWNDTFGFGIFDGDAGGSLDANSYFKPGETNAAPFGPDPLGAARFQFQNAAGVLQIDAGATFQAGQLTGGGVINLNGAVGTPGVLDLANQATATVSAANTLALLGTTPVGTLRTGTNQRFTISTLLVAAGGTLTKTGSGALVIANGGIGTLSTGATLAISEGRVVVNGTTSGAGTISVGTGTPNTGTLSGTGTVSNALAIANGGTLEPGDSGPGRLTATAAVTLTGGATARFALNGTAAGTGYSQLDLTGGGSINLGNSTLATTLGYVPSGADVLTIVANGAVTNQFAGLSDGQQFVVGSFGGTAYFATIDYQTNAVVLTNFSPVPEPFCLFALGTATLLAVRRRTRL